MVRFERVKDPERARKCDLVVLPALKSLNLKVHTIGDLGLSIGSTCRSSNDVETVQAWLSRKDMEPRVFLIADVSPKMVKDGENLLGLDLSPTPEEPELFSATMVPYGTPGWATSNTTWCRQMWAGCWDSATGGRLSAQLGKVAGFRALDRNHVVSRSSAVDMYATQVWDGAMKCSGRLDSAYEPGSTPAVSWFPFRQSGDPSRSFAEMTSLMSWTGSFHSRRQRIWLRSGFLTELVKRGALVVRPAGEEFAERTTQELASWCLGELARRFTQRVDASETYLKGLRADIASDKGRVRGFVRDAARAKRVAGPLDAVMRSLKRGGVK